ncbi:MAG: HIT family protein [Balneolales bacterium]|nr:HIT family protein [Balneolales bacterium]
MTIFSRIINGELPCYKIAEDDRHFAFLDINPASRGHVLVIPKQETDYIFDLDDELLKSLITFAKPIAKAMDRALKPIRTGIMVEGLEVPHAHIHLIPLYTAGQYFSLGKKVKLSKAEMEETAQLIRSELS